MGSKPLGANPPCAVRLPMLGAIPAHKPDTYAPATTKNKTIAATLMEANQNSNSPKDLTETKLVTVRDNNTVRLISHAGTVGSQNCTSAAPATASSATTMTQKYQYIQPVKNPASALTAGRSLHANRAYS